MYCPFRPGMNSVYNLASPHDCRNIYVCTPCCSKVRSLLKTWHCFPLWTRWRAHNHPEQKLLVHIPCDLCKHHPHLSFAVANVLHIFVLLCWRIICIKCPVCGGCTNCARVHTVYLTFKMQPVSWEHFFQAVGSLWIWQGLLNMQYLSVFSVFLHIPCTITEILCPQGNDG